MFVANGKELSLSIDRMLTLYINGLLEKTGKARRSERMSVW